MFDEIRRLTKLATPELLEPARLFEIDTDYGLAWRCASADFVDYLGSRAPALHIRGFR